MSLFLPLTLLATLTGGREPISSVPPQLKNQTWELTRISLVGQIVAPDPRLKASVNFDDFRTFGRSGCNGYSAPTTVQGQRIKIGQVVMTQMACADPLLSSQEGQFLNALTRTQRYQLIGQTLILFGKDKTSLTFKATKQGGTMQQTLKLSDLEGEWRISEIKLEQEKVKISTTTHLTLKSQGNSLQLAGSAGCNQLSGTGQLSGTTLSFGPLAATRMACEDMSAEFAFAQILKSPLQVEVNKQAANLSWTSDKGKVVLERVNHLQK